MPECVYCSKNTQLFVNGQPVCLKCMGRSEVRKPTAFTNRPQKALGSCHDVADRPGYYTETAQDS